MVVWFKKHFGDGRSSSKKERFYYGWIMLAALLVISIIAFGMHQSFGVFFIPLQEDFGWSRALTSGVYSLFLLLSSVMAIFGGWALDRYGPRIVFIVMGVFTGLSLLLSSQVSVPWHLFITYSVLLAIGIGPIWVTSMAATLGWFEKRRGLALGIIAAAVGIGIIIVPLVSTYLVSGYGWQNSFLILAVFTFIILIPCALLLKRPPSGLADLPEGGRLEVASHNSLEGQNYKVAAELSLPQAVKTRNFWLIGSVLFFTGVCSFAVIAHVVPYAIDLGITSMRAASILSLIGGLTIVGALIAGKVSDNIGRKQATMVCVLLMAGAMLWLIVSSDLWMFYLFAVFFGFSYGGFAPPLMALMGDNFGTRHIGLIMGVLEIGWGVGGAFGPALAGYLFDITGNYIFAFFLVGVVALLIGAVSIIFMRQPQGKHDFLMFC
ncbi:MFS transporter [Chloroflexota bacterium]